MDFQDIFSIGNFYLGLFKGIQHRINTGNALPIKSKLRRTPLGFQTEEEEHLKSMLDKGIIVPSASEWSSAPGLVRKKEWNC